MLCKQASSGVFILKSLYLTLGQRSSSGVIVRTPWGIGWERRKVLKTKQSHFFILFFCYGLSLESYSFTYLHWFDEHTNSISIHVSILYRIPLLYSDLLLSTYPLLIDPPTHTQRPPTSLHLRVNKTGRSLLFWAGSTARQHSHLYTDSPAPLPVHRFTGENRTGVVWAFSGFRPLLTTKVGD